MRLRIRFSIRTLALAVTLVCVYFGTWEMTARYGSDDVGVRYSTETGAAPGSVFPIAPLLFAVEDRSYPLRTITLSGRLVRSRHFYLWLFGTTVKLPFKFKIPIEITTAEPSSRQS